MTFLVSLNQLSMCSGSMLLKHIIIIDNITSSKGYGQYFYFKQKLVKSAFSTI